MRDIDKYRDWLYDVFDFPNVLETTVIRTEEIVSTIYAQNGQVPLTIFSTMTTHHLCVNYNFISFEVSDTIVEVFEQIGNDASTFRFEKFEEVLQHIKDYFHARFGTE